MTDLSVILGLRDQAREIMRSYGNVYQWPDGYPRDDMFKKDIELGGSHVMQDEKGTIVGTFALLPSPEVVEYVKPVEEPVPDEMVDEDMDVLLGMGADADSATIAQVVEMQRLKKDSIGVSPAKMREYNAKAEAIFRKQFTKAADAIISEVYNANQMNGSEQSFNAKSKIMTERLSKLQNELCKSTTLSPDRASGISSQIIEQLTEKKKAAMEKDYYGVKKQKDEQEAEAKKNEQKQ